MILLMLARRINYSYSTADANLKLGVAYPALRIFGYYSIWQIKGVTLSLFQEEESCFRLAMHEELSTRRKADDNVHDGAIPAYLLDRDETTRAKVLSNTIKQKRKEKAGKWYALLLKTKCLK